MTNVSKRDGRTEEFMPEKIVVSAVKSGASPEAAREIAGEVGQKAGGTISTQGDPEPRPRGARAPEPRLAAELGGLRPGRQAARVERVQTAGGRGAHEVAAEREHEEQDRVGDPALEPAGAEGYMGLALPRT